MIVNLRCLLFTPSPLRGTLGSSLRSPAEGEGQEGFPPPPEEDLDKMELSLQETLLQNMWLRGTFLIWCALEDIGGS